VPTWTLQTAAAAGVFLCLPLVWLFLCIRQQIATEGVWQRFCQAALGGCPRWIWGCMSLSIYLLIVVGIASAMFGLPDATFQTAGLLLPASAALSYSVSLWRTASRRAQQTPIVCDDRGNRIDLDVRNPERDQ
jgi:hypothetical protein